MTFLPLLISLLGIIGKEERRFPHYSNKDDKYVYTEIDSVYFECVVADGSYHRYVGMHHQSGYIFKDVHVALAVACVSAAFSKRYRYVWCSMALLIMFISFLCHKDML